MSVDIEELAAHLERQRLKLVKEQFDERAINATTAFLLCFFLGYLGAHRFYLGQWRSGLAHLALFALGAAGVIVGLIVAAPLNAALLVLGGLLILVSLIWEIIDLGRIDGEIHQRNTLLAEGLIAGALLSDSSAAEGATSKLDEAVRTAAEQSRAAAAPAGMISADDLAQARALAEESGQASISYHEVSNLTVSATPEERAGAAPTFEPPITATERHVITEPLPAAQDTAPVAEAETHTHTEDAYRVTDSDETDRVSGPSAGEVIGMGAAALGAAGLGYGLAEAAHAQEPLASERALEAAPEEPAMAETAAAAPEAPYVAGDVTDAGAPAIIEPAADVAFASSYPGYIILPEEPAMAPSAGAFASEANTSPVTGAATSDAVTEPDIPLYFTPEEPATERPSPIPPAAPEPAAESYVPPVPDVYSSTAPQPETYRPSWEVPTEPVAPALEPTPPSRESEAMSGLAGLAGVAGAGALAADALAHTGAEPAPAEPAPAEPAPAEPAPAEPAAPKMKRIRVKRRIVVEGQVVREEVVEREIPADMDMALAARQIQEELAQSEGASPDEIARLANLSSDEEVEVRRHVEGLGQQD